jgi:signal transduction histidine kinase
VRHAIGETSRGERDFDVTHRIVLPDGSIKYVHVLSHAVKDSAGNREVAGAIADVTQQRTIIQAHGGLLWARPNTPRGAVFAFTIPVEVEQDL